MCSKVSIGEGRLATTRSGSCGSGELSKLDEDIAATLESHPAPVENDPDHAGDVLLPMSSSPSRAPISKPEQLLSQDWARKSLNAHAT